MSLINTYRFYKEFDHRWYIDLPDYPGVKAELEMVEGADDMLHYMCEGNSEVYVIISRDAFDGADRLIYQNIEIDSGAFYHMPSYKGIEINLNMWLCDVTKYVFGDFPEIIYIQALDAN